LFLLAFGQLSADGMISRGAVGIPGQGHVLSIAVSMKAPSSCCHCVVEETVLSGGTVGGEGLAIL